MRQGHHGGKEIRLPVEHGHDYGDTSGWVATRTGGAAGVRNYALRKLSPHRTRCARQPGKSIRSHVAALRGLGVEKRNHAGCSWIAPNSHDIIVTRDSYLERRQIA